MHSLEDLLQTMSNRTLIADLSKAIGHVVPSPPEPVNAPMVICADHHLIAIAAAKRCEAEKIAGLEVSGRRAPGDVPSLAELVERFSHRFFKGPISRSDLRGGGIAFGHFIERRALKEESVDEHLASLAKTCRALRIALGDGATGKIYILTNIDASIDKIERETDSKVQLHLTGQFAKIYEQLLTQTNFPNTIVTHLRGLADEKNVEIEAVMRLLNSNRYRDLRRHAFERAIEKGAISPEPKTLFDQFVMDPQERSPRHSAALYVASNFSEISPAEFVDIADRLSANTPTTTPASDEPRPPERLTDLVLDQCQIRLEPEENEARFISGKTVDEAMASGAFEAEIKRLFRERAPLLSEQYLHTLALAMTLGHPSEAIAKKYIELEIDALALAADISRSPSAAAQRLSRVVFGYAAVTHASDEYYKFNIDSMSKSLRLALLRTPQLLNDLQVRLKSPTMSKAILAELLSVRPVTAEAERWADEFDDNIVALFWTMFAQAPDVSVTDFPALTQSADETLTSRRIIAVDRFREVIHQDKGLVGADVLRTSTTLWRLLADVSGALDMLNRAEKAPARLLMLIAAKLIGEAQTELDADGPASVAHSQVRQVIEALLSDQAQEWIAGRVAVAEDGAELARAAYEKWIAAGAGLEMITGASGYGKELSFQIRSLWITEVASTYQIDIPFFDYKPFWEVISSDGVIIDDDPDGAKARLVWLFVSKVITPLIEAVSVGVIMMVTARPGDDGPRFVFDEDLRTWLRNGTIGSGAVSPLHELLRRANRCREIATGWSDFRPAIDASGLRIPGATHRAAAGAFRDRQIALSKFVAALRAISQP
ncbi:hypothetical protein DBR17_15790 [Sphingomonas sp. HMWF008]|nr:hypothetical protein DBR17_15790 [Sphingomonas sp. HMWF008]